MDKATAEKNIKQKYKEKVSENEKEVKENIEFYKPETADKIVAEIMIFFISVFTFFLIVYCFKINYVFSNNEVSSDCETDGTVFVDSVGEENQISVIFQYKELYSKDSKRIKRFSVVLFCSYLIVAFLVISLLLYLVNRSDCGIRFAKLNELHNLRESILLDFSDKVKTENIKEIETEQIQTSIPNDFNKSSVSNVNINYNLPAKTAKKEKNLYSEFLKNYMNAVVEI